MILDEEDEEEMLVAEDDWDEEQWTWKVAFSESLYKRL